VEIAVDNVWATILDASKAEIDWLVDYLSVPDARYKPQPVGATRLKVAEDVPDPRYFIVSRGRFPAGLMPVVERAAASAGIKLLLLSNKQAPCAAEATPDVAWLRPYQLDVLNRLRRFNRGLVKAPTGSGKTELMIALTRLYPCEWLMVVHKADLTKQAAERYAQRTGESAGTWDNKSGWRRGTCNFTVATFQGIAAAIRKHHAEVWEFLDSVQGLLVDEVHSQPAETFYNVTMGMKDAWFRYGFSGTPLDRGEIDSLRTIGAIGPLVASIKTQTLIASGDLAKAEIRMVACRQPASAAGVKWGTVYKGWVVRSRERNELLAQMAARAAKPCMVYVEEYAHADELAKEFSRLGLSFGQADGTMGVDQRKRKVQALEDCEFDVLITTAVLQDGIDIPSLRAVIVGSGKSSHVAAIQRMGRGSRLHAASNKTTFEVWDVLDKGQRWLADHASDRVAAYEKEGHTINYGWP
jgi:superfamily II DNA or RNA helicase